MNEQPRQKLIELVARYGHELADDPKRCESFLRDVCGEHKKEIAVLVAAVREGIAAKVRASSRTVPNSVLVTRLAKLLEDNHGITPQFALWSIETWTIALGKEAVASPSSSSPEKTAPGITCAPTNGIGANDSSKPASNPSAEGKYPVCCPLCKTRSYSKVRIFNQIVRCPRCDARFRISADGQPQRLDF